MTTELTRINGPRVEKLVAALAVIEKSCKSNRAHELDVARLLAPVAEKLDAMLDADAMEMTRRPVYSPTGSPIPEGKPCVPAKPTLDPALHSTRATLEAMSVQELASLMGMVAAQIDIKVNP